MKEARLIYFCDFCEKSQDQVERIIAGTNNAAICSECVSVCVQIIQEEKAKEDGNATIQQ